MTYLQDSRRLVDGAPADVDAFQSDQRLGVIKGALFDQSQPVVVRAGVGEEDGLTARLDLQEARLEVGVLLLALLVLEPRTEP